MKISIFGLGYVGCVSLGCLAKNGNYVYGVDVDPVKIELLNSGVPTIIEKEIDVIIKEQFLNKTYKATQNVEEAVINSDVSFIAVGTPNAVNGHLDLTYVERVAREIGEVLKYKDDYHVIVVRSTVLPGTNDSVAGIIGEFSGKIRGVDFDIVSNPEFLREGSAVNDYYNPSVTVIGSSSDRASKLVASLYETIEAPIMFVDAKEAEIIKYVNNAYHALKITFANEIGNICKSLGIDGRNVMEIFVKDDKLNISKAYFRPGFAYGGSCLPKDLLGLKTLSHDNYLESPVLESIEKSNFNQKRQAIKVIEKHNCRKIGILGLSFKPGTDDLRHSPIVEVAEYFLGKGYDLKIYDRNVTLSKITGTNKAYIEKHIPHLSNLLMGFEEVIENSELVVITHDIPGVSNQIINNPDKTFVDLIGVIDFYPKNYVGLSW
jgi:GDP-mannose 6-dehydrogenase